jgi:hypothetical protein
VASFWRECNEVLSTAVPHYLAPCWFTFDPASLLVTSHYDPVIPEISAGFLAHEYLHDDVLKMADVAVSGSGVTTIHEVTGGDPGRSPGWRDFVQPYGGDHQLMVALRNKPTEPWGLLALYRETGQREFDRDEISFLAAVAGPLAEGARRGLLLGEATDPDSPHAPSLIVLDEDWQVHSMTPGAQELLAELPGGDVSAARGALPACVLSVAGRALRSLETAETTGPGRGGTRAIRQRPLDDPARSTAAARRQPARGGHRRARRSRQTGSAADGSLRADQPLEGRHPLGTARRNHVLHRSQPVRLAADRAAAPEEHLREDRRPEPARARRQGVLRAL